MFLLIYPHVLPLDSSASNAIVNVSGNVNLTASLTLNSSSISIGQTLFIASGGSLNLGTLTNATVVNVSRTLPPFFLSPNIPYLHCFSPIMIPTCTL